MRTRLSSPAPPGRIQKAEWSEASYGNTSVVIRGSNIGGSGGIHAGPLPTLTPPRPGVYTAFGQPGIVWIAYTCVNEGRGSIIFFCIWLQTIKMERNVLDGKERFGQSGSP